MSHVGTLQSQSGVSELLVANLYHAIVIYLVFIIEGHLICEPTSADLF